MARKSLLTLTAAVLLTANAFAAQVTQYLKLCVIENSNVAVQQPFSFLYSFSLSGTDGLDAYDMGNQNSISNPGDDVYPFSVSNNGDIHTTQDARPDLFGYKKIRMGFLSKNPSTIKVIASAFGNTTDSTHRPTYAWIEQISTGNIYYFFNDTAEINIPDNINFTADFYLHTGPAIEIEYADETCFSAYDGDLSVRNPNCAAWKLTVLHNANVLFSDSIFQADTTLLNLTAGTYTIITCVNSVHVDSTVLVMTSQPQLVADFVVGNYTPTTDDVITFTDNSAGVDPSVTYFYTFGDGYDDAQASTSHQYGIAGTYEIVLTLTSVYGCTSTVLDSVHVTQGMSLSSSFNQVINHNHANTSENNSEIVYEQIGMDAAPGTFRILVTQHEAQQMDVMIINAAGQLISTTQTSDAKIELEVPSTGIYIVRVMNAKKEVQTKTIMVTN